MPSEMLYREILKWQRTEYAACDAERRVYEYSPGFLHLAQRASGPLRGQKLEDLFDELAGSEADLAQVVQGARPCVQIEKIYREIPPAPAGYLTLTIVPFPPGLLLLAQDVTREGQLEQRITQQRNELDLLAGQLVAARAQLVDLLHRFLPRSLAQRAIANPAAVRLGGERREVTMFFADVRGYSALAEKLEPTALMDLLNERFAVLGQIITAHSGVIHQYVGDMLTASFNSLDPQPEHAQHAVQAAREAQVALRALPAIAEHHIAFGIGIHTGPVIVGFLGYEDRFDFTTIGETTNIAARLCAKAQAGEILIGPTTYEAVRAQQPTRPLGPLQLKGKQAPVEVYVVLP